MLLADKVALVSGIGPGMGRDISLAFAREGADLILAARDAARIEAVAAEVRACGRRALAVATDITDPQQCSRLVEQAVNTFGGIDILVNNAFKGGLEPPVAAAKLDDWKSIFEVNLFGSLRLTQQVVPSMRARGGGSIVFINSMSMRIIEAGFGAYAASKAALLTAAQTLARELGKDKIRVNSVVPGYIWSEKLAAYFAWLAQQQNTTPEAVYENIAARAALHHIPTSAEIADTVVFFASDLARVVTGQSLDVNAGHHFS